MLYYVVVFFSKFLCVIVLNTKALFNSYSWTGITFSFFWKNNDVDSRFAIASGGKIISSGFSVYSNPHGGYVEFYTRGDSKTWKAHIKLPGSYYLSVWGGFQFRMWKVLKWFGEPQYFALSLKPKNISHDLKVLLAWPHFEIHSGLELHLQSNRKYFEYVVLCIIILITSRCPKVLESIGCRINFFCWT